MDAPAQTDGLRLFWKLQVLSGAVALLVTVYLAGDSGSAAVWG